MYYVYVLKNNEGKHYIGSCVDLETRLKKHNQNSVRSTKHKGPFKVVHKEKFDSRTEARQRENQLKNYKGGRAFRKLIEELQPPSSSLV
ncbi:MAG: GIY-YIG nuclease family protein [Candidatus Omnitrophica bacterium]|nr:GIY-YIG nuclease family protein [Candidatus Omnitrophota bacterium]MDD5351615.1 GIY-YIG nuclease family protein [Candidatus Omnitrophota bacterium]MDD5550825.1 GIY-YIG nuclease family protein [Candidatus Omnitrophota bacterium]